MKKQATIVRWNTAQGFGFMREKESIDVFFHIKDWRGAGQPMQGLVVEYEEIHVGGKGPRGMAVQPIGQRAAPPRSRVRQPPTRRPDSNNGNVQALIAIVWTAVVLWCCVSGRLPLWVLMALALVNIATFFAYSFDKFKARKRLWRTPEQTLHGLALLGGWPAASLAQRLLRHKSSKTSFLDRDRAMAVLNILAMLAWAFVGR